MHRLTEPPGKPFVQSRESVSAVHREKPALDSYRQASTLGGLLARVIVLRNLYKRAYHQNSNRVASELQWLFNKHQIEQTELVRLVSVRVQTLGRIALAADGDEEPAAIRPVFGREEVLPQLDRLMDNHKIILIKARSLVLDAIQREDEKTTALLRGQVVPINELQSWLVASHQAVRGRIRGGG